MLKQIFGAQQTDTISAVGVDVQEIFTAVDVDAYGDAFAIRSQCRLMGVRERLGLKALQPRTGQLILFERLLIRVDEETTTDSIDYTEHAAGQLQDFRPGTADEGDAQTAGQNCGVGGGGAGGQSNAYDVGLIKMGGIEGGQVLGEQDCAVR